MIVVVFRLCTCLPLCFLLHQALAVRLGEMVLGGEKNLARNTVKFKLIHRALIVVYRNKSHRCQGQNNCHNNQRFRQCEA